MSANGFLHMPASKNLVWVSIRTGARFAQAGCWDPQGAASIFSQNVDSSESPFPLDSGLRTAGFGFLLGRGQAPLAEPIPLLLDLRRMIPGGPRSLHGRNSQRVPTLPLGVGARRKAAAFRRQCSPEASSMPSTGPTKAVSLAFSHRLFTSLAPSSSGTSQPTHFQS